MSNVFDNLSDEAKIWAMWIGYLGVCIGVSYLMYKAFAVMVGKAVATELIKAGVIAVL